jgi:hypothetical protein
MKDILEKIQNQLNDSRKRMKQYRKDDENDTFRYFSNLLISEITGIINEFTSNLNKQKHNAKN